MTEQRLSEDGLALDVRRLVLAPGERSPQQRAPAGETFLYVISGEGLVHGANDTAELRHESVVWLQAGDAWSLAASDDGLELLLAHAPAGAGEAA